MKNKPKKGSDLEKKIHVLPEAEGITAGAMEIMHGLLFSRAVMIPGLESAPEYDRSMIFTLFRGDSGSGSFQVDPLESAPVLESAPLVVLFPLLVPFKPSEAYYFLF